MTPYATLVVWNNGRELVTNIRKKAEAITTENMLEFVGPVYQLEKALENPLDIAYHFYLDGEDTSHLPKNLFCIYGVCLYA